MTVAVPPSAAETKADLRTAMMRRRDALPESVRHDAAIRIAEHVQSLPIGPGEIVSAFWPMRSEVDVRPALHALDRAGVTLALPAVIGPQRLAFRRWRPGDPLVRAGFGTSEPPEDAVAIDPTLLLVPLLAFTGAGDRLGYGGGFYDATLARLGPSARAVGVAFACQEVASLPVEPHDVRLPAVLTEAGLMECHGAARA